ncbi:MAG TPA: VCBS repeat-containing protein [Planctomycetota bacterium]|nr:VCBS repeat-containing protein [Planctomycetota bacterium]
MDLSLEVALGDVDGDGALDVFVGNAGNNRLYRNDGTGVFGDVSATNLPSTLLPNPNAETRAIALGDLDGDGDLDAILGVEGLGGQGNRLYLNGGAGVFADATVTNLPVASGARTVALGDVDSDGDPDAFLGSSCSSGGIGQGHLFLNGGASVFTDVTTTNLPAIGCATRAAAFGDLDGDGDLDLYVGTIGLERFLRNDGSGVFTDATAGNLPTMIDPTEAVALGDVDGDGDLDAFVGNATYTGPQPSRLYLNNGTGAFADVTATNLPGLTGATYDVELGDVDGDGDLDALVGNGGYSGPGNRLDLNNGSGVFTIAPATSLPGSPEDTQAVALGDVDGDGDLDAVVVNNGYQNRLYLNDGVAAFVDVTSTTLPGEAEGTGAVALGDVDGDGDLDAFLGNYEGDRLFRNDGTGSFADATPTSLFPPLFEFIDAVALGDLDGDGDLDALLGVGNPFDPSPGQIRRYMNAGTGVFTLASFPASSGYMPWAVALGDLDGDGDLDAYVGTAAGQFGGGQNRLYRNLGAGTFTDVTTTSLPPVVDSTRGVGLGDVDGDGDLDVFVGNGNAAIVAPEQNRLYLNGGTGVFTDATATNLPSILDGTGAVALGDVDGDGDLDAFVGNVTGPLPSRLLLNGGTGVFTDVTATNLAIPAPTPAVVLGDVDGDGDLDALVVSGSGYPLFTFSNRLLQNDGTGIFMDLSTGNLPVPADYTRALALGDVDGDGDLDAFVGTGGRDRIFTNLSRQLAWRGLPRIGKPLTLDIRGPSWGAWFLGVSPGTASVPIPPLGTLRLAPASLLFVLGGLLDAQGRAAFTIPVPANAGLVGISVYWQGVVAAPARFTSLEVATLTNL